MLKVGLMASQKEKYLDLSHFHPLPIFASSIALLQVSDIKNAGITIPLPCFTPSPP